MAIGNQVDSIACEVLADGEVRLKAQNSKDLDGAKDDLCNLPNNVKKGAHMWSGD